MLGGGGSGSGGGGGVIASGRKLREKGGREWTVQKKQRC